jgi:hypothetical protein
MVRIAGRRHTKAQRYMRKRFGLVRNGLTGAGLTGFSSRFGHTSSSIKFDTKYNGNSICKRTQCILDAQLLTLKSWQCRYLLTCCNLAAMPQ